MPAGNLGHYKADAVAYPYVADAATELGQAEMRRAELLVRMAAETSDSWASRCAVDVGMGGGQLLALLHGRGVRAVGFDLALQNCHNARLGRWRGGGPWLAAADAFALPLRDGTASAVFISEVLEHLVDPAAAVCETARILAPGGILVASCPWREAIVEHLCIHCNRPTPVHAHLHSVDEEKLAAWMSAAGLRPARTLRFNSILMQPLQLTRRTRWLGHAGWRLVDGTCRLAFRPRHFSMAALK